MPTARTKAGSVVLTWMIARHIPAVVAIDAAASSDPLIKPAFVRLRQATNVIGLVASRKDTFVGYVFYELSRNGIQIVRMAVTPETQRTGVGTAFITRIKERLDVWKRPSIAVNVRESALPAQLFLRACGFKAVRVVREHFPDTFEDAFVFEYRIER